MEMVICLFSIRLQLPGLRVGLVSKKLSRSAQGKWPQHVGVSVIQAAQSSVVPNKV